MCHSYDLSDLQLFDDLSELSEGPAGPSALDLQVVDQDRKEHFMKDLKSWKCGFCGKTFAHHYTLMRHLPIHTGERKFLCNTCGKSFRQMSTLSQHKAIHSSQRPFSCEVCGKTFNRISTLISHRKTHTGHKLHQCPVCFKAFHQKGNLRNHIFTHTNERPYKCDVCQKGFNQMSNLMCHKLKVHKPMEGLKHVCDLCKESFTQKQALKHHQEMAHGLHFESNAILVERIQTEAMKLALEQKQTPFALLRPLSGIPVLVKVVSAGLKDMLIPATAEDLKAHGHISITPKLQDNKFEGKKGNAVKIKIPVVATVIQQNGVGGVTVVSPGPESSNE